MVQQRYMFYKGNEYFRRNSKWYRNDLISNIEYYEVENEQLIRELNWNLGMILNKEYEERKPKEDGRNI